MKLKKLLASVTAAALALTTVAATSFTSVSAETEEIVTVYKAGDASAIPDYVLWSKEVKAAFTEDVTSFTVTIDGDIDGDFEGAGEVSFIIHDTYGWNFIPGKSAAPMTKEYVNSANDGANDSAWETYLTVAAGVENGDDDGGECDIRITPIGYTAVRSISVTFNTDADDTGSSSSDNSSTGTETTPAETESGSEETTTAAASSEEFAGESEDQGEAAAVMDVVNDSEAAVTAAESGKTFEIYNFKNGVSVCGDEGVRWTVKPDSFSQITSTDELKKCYAEVTFSSGTNINLGIQPDIDISLSPWNMAVWGGGESPAKVSLAYASDEALNYILSDGFAIDVYSDGAVVEEVTFMLDSEEGDNIIGLSAKPEGFEYENVIREIIPTAENSSFPVTFEDDWSFGCTSNGKYYDFIWFTSIGKALDDSVYSNENVYLKVVLSDIGPLLPEDPDEEPLEFDSSVVYESNRWAAVMAWRSGDDEGNEIICQFRPIEGCTAEEAVIYAPISALKVLDDGGYICGGIQNGAFSKITIESMEIVEFSDEQYVEEEEDDDENVLCVPAKPEGKYEIVLTEIVPLTMIDSFPAVFETEWNTLGNEDEGLYVQTKDWLDPSVYSDKDVYVKVTFSDIGSLWGTPYDDMLAQGWDAYKSLSIFNWFYVDEETGEVTTCPFVPVTTSTASKAVAYMPISAASVLDVNNYGFIGGGAMSAFADGVTVESMSVVRITDELPSEETPSETPSVTPSDPSSTWKPAPGIAPAGYNSSSSSTAATEKFNVTVENKITKKSDTAAAEKNGSKVTVSLGSGNDGYYANIYTKDGVYVCSAIIANGKAEFSADVDSSFKVVIDEFSYGDDVSSAAGLNTYAEAASTAAYALGIIALTAILGASAIVIRRRFVK